jgi:hypothetical protein
MYNSHDYKAYFQVSSLALSEREEKHDYVTKRSVKEKFLPFKDTLHTEH